MSAENPTSGESICSLLDQARGGSTTAQAQLFQQLESYLAAVAEKHVEPSLRPKLAASDLVQQSFAVAVEHFDQFNGQSEGELFAWVTTIIKNELKQNRRAFYTDKRNINRERPFVEDSQAPQRGADLADRMPTPGTQADLAEQKRALATAISLLPDEFQQVIRLRNWERLPFREIAEHMQQPISVVTRLWYRALVSLQNELEQNDGGQTKR